MNVTVLDRIEMEGLININIAVLGTPGKSSQHMKRYAEAVAWLNTSRYCAGQCRDSDKARGYQQVAGWCTKASRIGSPVH